MNNLIPAITSAMALIKQLKEKNEAGSSAEIAPILKELESQLAQAKAQATDLLEEKGKLEKKLIKIKESSGDICPKCKSNTYNLSESRPHPLFGEVGMKERTYLCSTCGFKESKTVE